MAIALFYEQPVSLNRNTHKDTCVAETRDFTFAARTWSVPLAGVEFGAAARYYGIVFGGSEASKAMPLAILGAREGENRFVDNTGHWKTDYVPAFVRRYPFILMESKRDSGADETEQDEARDEQTFVAVDQKYIDEHPGTDEKDRLFDADRKDTERMLPILKFLREFQSAMQATHSFVTRVAELDLLQRQRIQVVEDGRRAVINDVFVVDESRLQALDADVISELAKSGALHWIYAHLLSLRNLDTLVAQSNASTAKTI